jgi:vitamin B12 transporter
LYGYHAAFKVDSGFSVLFNGGYSTMKKIGLNDSSLVDNAGHYDSQYFKETYTGTTAVNDIQFHFRQKGFDVLLGGGMNNQTMSYQSYYYSPFYTSNTNLDSLHLASRTNSFFILANVNGSVLSEKAKAFSLSVGARSNKNNIFGNSITWNISPMVKVSSTTSLYGNFSTGYNAPSLYQLYSPPGNPTDSVKRGNVNLRPETSLTQEFGVYQKINDKTGIRIGYYQTVIKDVIEYAYIWNKNTPVNALTYADYMGDTYLNLGTLHIDGIELEAHGTIGKKFLLAGNFTYVRGHQLNSYESIDTVKTRGNHVQLFSSGGFVSQSDVHTTGLVRRPSTGNLSLTYSPTEKVFFKTIVKMVSGRKDVIYDPVLGPYGAQTTTPLQAFTLVDLISGVKFDAHIFAMVRVENVFDVKYTEIRGYTTRGRGIYLSVNYTF